MRDPKRIDKVTNELNRVWKKHPDLRLFQLLAMVFGTDDHFHLEDDKILNQLKLEAKVKK